MTFSLLIKQIFEYLLLAFGFGFVIFIHELGHFLAAKYCDVKVEQFAIGFGPAILAWRKGLGVRWGTTQHEYVRRTEQYLASGGNTGALANDGDNGSESKPPAGSWTERQIAEAATKLSFSDTEYRLNWIPLGGYVKMLGQDDLRPGMTAEDPRAYNNKPIRSRMLIVSAGVIMNVILAAVGFIVLFLNGWPTPAAVAGVITSQSPAMNATLSDGKPAPLRPGDAILTFNGHTTRQDFTKVMLWAALTKEDQRVPVVVRRHGPDYTTDVSKLPVETIYVTPAHPESTKGLLAMGVEGPFLLEGPEAGLDAEFTPEERRELLDANASAIQTGDAVMAINGQPVQKQEIWKLLDALAQSDGKSVDLTIRTAAGQTVHRSVLPHFEQSFVDESPKDFDFIGMRPRASVVRIDRKSPARGKLMPGDVIIAVTALPHFEQEIDPDIDRLTDTFDKIGKADGHMNLTVLSAGDSQPHETKDLHPNVKLPNSGRRGLNFATGLDEQHAVVGGVREKSPMDGKIAAGDTILAIDGHPVSNWFDVRRWLASASPDKDIAIQFKHRDQEQPLSTSVKLSAAQIASMAQINITFGDVSFEPMQSNLKTASPLVAIGWGVEETRDLILQFYLTIQRMVIGSVPINSVMGPVGIVQAGAAVAVRGTKWLIWFLAMISANLAVVNFLPIPIVDGGLFTFLILEKIQGRPLSLNTQKIVQMVGLALILGVFLLVTYQDVARWMGY